MRTQIIDLETTGLNPFLGAEIFSYALCDLDGNSTVHRLDGSDKKKNWNILQKFMEDTSIIKVAHNYHFEYNFLKEFTIVPDNTTWHDTMLMSQCLRNLAPSHALDYLAWELCGWSRLLDKEIKRMGKAYGGYQNIPVDKMTEYQHSDVQRCALLFKLFLPEIKANPKQYKDYLKEIELIPAKYQEEKHGIMIHRGECNKLKSHLEDELETVQEECTKLLGYLPNLGSWKQLSKILFEDMKLPILKNSKKTKEAATDKMVLVELQGLYPKNKFLNMILKYRSYTTGVANINNYLGFVDSKDILHPNVKSNEARTGRQSCSNPNLQNVAKEEARNNPFPVPARRCFRPELGYVLEFGDYAGQELRLIVDTSGDKEMMRILKSDGDMHGEGAKEWYGNLFIKETNAEKKEVLRTAAKSANFAKAYGAGVDKIALTLGISLDLAYEGDKRFTRRFPRVAGFSKMLVSQIIENGYIDTPFGRRLYITPDKAYVSGNYMIQGTAAGMLKRAEIGVNKYCLEIWNGDIWIIIPIHDELMLSVPRKLLKYEKKILGEVKEIMCYMPELKVPMDVEWKRSTTTWAQAKGVKLC